MNYQAFVDEKRAFVVAPAGYGKTYTIAKCLEFTRGRQLILTHTHAGISSIKEKLKNLEIPSSSYSVETISSFAQKYVMAFYANNTIPDQEDDSYHPFIIKQATEIIKTLPVSDILKASYAGMFIDEYQDCTNSQHNLVMILSGLIPTRILGDHLQAIFDFNEDLNDFPNSLIKNNFKRFPDLETPHRWSSSPKSILLGNELKKIRSNLENQLAIDLTPYQISYDDNGRTIPPQDNKGIFFLKASPEDKIKSESNYKKTLNKIVYNTENKQTLNSLLVIMPTYEEVLDGKKILRGGIGERKKISQLYQPLLLIEAIDDKSFYSLAKKIDSLIGDISNARKPYAKVLGLLIRIFKKTDFKDWLTKKDDGDYSFTNKRDDFEKIKSAKIKKTFDDFVLNPSAGSFYIIVTSVLELLKLKSSRPGVLSSVLKALEESRVDNIPLYEAMKNHRNLIRRSGRKVNGKCIGNTLLTKGLEFDTVVILDAHQFDCPKHLYVALTRCCKSLVIFSNSDNLMAKKISTN